MSLQTLFERLVSDLGNRKIMTDKLKIRIKSHSQGFELAPICTDEGYFLIRVYPHIPVYERMESDGEAVAVLKLTPSDTIRAKTFHDCWIEFFDISEAQYETYLEFGSLPEVTGSLKHNLNKTDKFTIWKFSLNADDSSISDSTPVGSIEEGRDSPATFVGNEDHTTSNSSGNSSDSI